MKRLYLLSSALVGAMSTYAQIGTVTIKEITTTTEEHIIEIDDSKYNRISVAAGAFHYDLSHAYNELYDEFDWGSGLALMAEYIHGWRLMKSKPLFFESGLACQLNASGISLAVPLDVTYRFMNKKGYYFAPFAGLNTNFQVYWWEDDEYYYKKVYYGPGHWDYESEMIYPAAKFIQLGYNIGANFGRKHWNIGLGYRGGFTPTYSTEDDGNVKSGFVYLGIGYNF